MMITPAPAPKQPEICASQWLNSETPCPQWIGYPTRLSLPIDLIWSGDTAVPGIGSRVHIYMNNFGLATVRAYFHADGYLGVICQPDEMPDWYKKQSPGVTLGHFFGRELEPRKPTPAAAALVLVPAEEELGRLSDQPDAAHEANGNNPGTNEADDWVPEYPDQDAEEPDDNQGAEAAAVPAVPVPFSEAPQLITGSQAATVQDVARQMKASPRKTPRSKAVAPAQKKLWPYGLVLTQI